MSDTIALQRVKKTHTKPKPTGLVQPWFNCDCAQLWYTVRHKMALIIFSRILVKIITAQKSFPVGRKYRRPIQYCWRVQRLQCLSVILCKMSTAMQTDPALHDTVIISPLLDASALRRYGT